MNRETAGFLASVLFVLLASVRDVYLGGLFQRLDPALLALVAFALCGVVFVPIAWVRDRASYRVLARHLRELAWINATAAFAWLSFFHALGLTEPLLVQIVFSGVGPPAVGWLRRLVPGAATTQLRGERVSHGALLAAVALAAGVAIGGLSGAAAPPVVVSALGVALAAAAGISITANTVLCRRLNDAGVDPAALVSVRFVGATIAAALLMDPARDLRAAVAAGALPEILGASVLLVVLPIYVNQIGVSLASPLTVRVVLAAAPALIFALQLAEGRLDSSPYSLAAAITYGAVAIASVIVRRRALRAAAPA
jgi:drug/metabolite transporter (DMT)-like permease